MIYKVIDRSRLPERFVWDGRWYATDMNWVKFVRKDGKTEIMASDNGVMWHRLTGTPILSFDSAPEPQEDVIVDVSDPIDYSL